MTTTRTHYRNATVNGRKIFYREAGDPFAPTILLLHGLPTSSQMFRELMPLLSDRFHLIAPDYVGFGHSDAPSSLMTATWGPRVWPHSEIGQGTSPFGLLWSSV